MKQLEFKKVNGWDGKRKGAGRPSRTGQPGHAKRPRVRLEYPIHITMRLKPLPVTLRSRQILQKLKACLKRARRFGLRVNQFVLLNRSLHAGEIPEPDYYSSGAKFRHWKRLLGDVRDKLVKGLGEHPLLDCDYLCPPESWLGRVGWRRAV